MSAKEHTDISAARGPPPKKPPGTRFPAGRATENKRLTASGRPSPFRGRAITRVKDVSRTRSDMPPRTDSDVTQCNALQPKSTKRLLSSEVRKLDRDAEECCLKQ